jgi:hypothetical protein
MSYLATVLDEEPWVHDQPVDTARRLLRVERGQRVGLIRRLSVHRVYTKS